MSEESNVEAEVQQVVAEENVVQETADVTAEKTTEEKPKKSRKKKDVAAEEKAAEEAEVKSEKDETSEVATETAATENTEAKPTEGKRERDPNEKFFSFEKNEARRFFISADKALSFVSYREISIGMEIRTQKIKNDAINTFNALIADIRSFLQDIRIPDSEFKDNDLTQETVDSITPGEDSVIIGRIYVPSAAQTRVWTNAIRKKIKSYLDETGKPYCYMHCKSLIYLRNDLYVDTAPVAKGFAAMGRVDHKEKDAPMDQRRAVYRGAVYLNKSIGIDDDQLPIINKHTLLTTKLSSFSADSIPEDPNYRFFKYYFNIRGTFHVLYWTILGKNEDGTFKVQRTLVRVTVRNRKIELLDEYIPIGIRVLPKVEEINIKTIDEIYKKDGKDILASASEVPEDNNLTEGMYDDLEVIQKIINNRGF